MFVPRKQILEYNSRGEVSTVQLETVEEYFVKFIKIEKQRFTLAIHRRRVAILPAKSSDLQEERNQFETKTVQVLYVR